MKFKKIYMFIVMLLLIVCTGCTSFNKQNEVIVLELGESVSLSSSYSNGKWNSSDESVVIVESNGIIKAVGYGSAIIEVTKGNSSERIEVTVENYDPQVELKINGKQTVEKSQTIKLNPYVTNINESVEYIFLSNDNEIATVDENGVVTGVSEGLVTITITANFSKTISEDFIIYVKEVGEKNVTNIIQNIEYVISGDLDLQTLSKKIESIVETYKESIMGVTNYQYVRNGFTMTLEQAGFGTGFIFKQTKNYDGSYTYNVLTNYHVIDDCELVKLYFGYEDVEVDAVIEYYNQKYDLAVLSFESTKDYEVLSFAENEDIYAGDFAIAIGNPQGYEYFGSVSFGIVSYNNRKMNGESATFVQHDVAINPGNSGGPLIDMNGNVIGVNTLKIVTTDVDNLGFSVDINTIEKFLR